MKAQEADWRTSCPQCGSSIVSHTCEWEGELTVTGELGVRLPAEFPIEWPAFRRITVECERHHRFDVQVHEWSQDRGHRFLPLESTKPPGG